MDILKALGPDTKRSTAKRALDELISERRVVKGERVAGKKGTAHGYRLVSDQTIVSSPDPLNTLVSGIPGSYGGVQGGSLKRPIPTGHHPTDVDPDFDLEVNDD